jgi:general secretion pathway protein I
MSPCRHDLAGGLAHRVFPSLRGGQARRLNGKPSRWLKGERSGFTLLEVILALAILAGAIAVIGEVSSLGMRNARLAMETTHAQLLCESKLAEIVAGVESLEAQENVPLGTVGDLSSEADWLYSVEINSTELTGLVEVRVTVRKDLPAEQRPASFTLVRWMLDPATAGSTSGTSTTEEASGGTSE